MAYFLWVHTVCYIIQGHISLVEELLTIVVIVVIKTSWGKTVSFGLTGEARTRQSREGTAESMALGLLSGKSSKQNQRMLMSSGFSRTFSHVFSLGPYPMRQCCLHSEQDFPLKLNLWGNARDCLLDILNPGRLTMKMHHHRSFSCDPGWKITLNALLLLF